MNSQFGIGWRSFRCWSRCKRSIPEELSGVFLRSKICVSCVWSICLASIFQSEEVQLVLGDTERGLLSIPADVAASRHGVCTGIAIDVICSGNSLWHHFGHVYLDWVSCFGVRLPIEETVCFSQLEEDGCGANSSIAADFPTVVVCGEYLHLKIILGTVDLVFGGMMETDVVDCPVKLMVLRTWYRFSCVPSTCVRKAKQLVDPVIETGGPNVNFAGIW